MSDLHLNEEQQLAVDTTEGVVVVIAGPGTGKTQLLSQRAVNILNTCDIAPSSLLCLTFTDAAAQNMRNRLSKQIGSAALEVDIFTFHAFAEHIRQTYPAHFAMSGSKRLISPFAQTLKIAEFLNELPITGPLFTKDVEGKHFYASSVVSLISKIKKLGLPLAEIRAAACQELDVYEQMSEYFAEIDYHMGITTYKAAFAGKSNVDFANYVNQHLTAALAGSAQDSDLVLSLKAQINMAVAVVLNDEKHKTRPLADLNKSILELDAKRKLVPKGLKRVQRFLEALTIYEKYISYCQTQKLYDYDDMIADVLSAICDNSDLKHNLQAKYEYVMVDEFQDTNGVQLNLLLEILHGDNPNLLIVGDDDQSIMGFQGAEPENFRRIMSRYPQHKSITLVKNYRSIPEIIEAVDTVGQIIPERLEPNKTLISGLYTNAADYVLPADLYQVKQYDSPAEQYAAVADGIKQLFDSGYVEEIEAQVPGAGKDAIAVIAPKHKSLAALIPRLESRGIAYNYRVKASVEQATSIETTLAVARYAAYYSAGDKQGACALLPQIMADPVFAIDNDEIINFVCNANHEQAKALAWLDSLSASSNPKHKTLSVYLNSIVNSALTDNGLITLHKISGPFVASLKSEAHLKLAPNCDSYATIEYFAALGAVCDFVNEYIESQPKAGRHYGKLVAIADVVAILDYAKLNDYAIDFNVDIAQSNAITLTSAHYAKGLEYNTVFLIDSDNHTWKRGKNALLSLPVSLATNADSVEGNALRLFFVALSRARDNLHIMLGKGNLLKELIDLKCQQAFGGDGNPVPLFEIEEIAPDLDSKTEDVLDNWQQRFIATQAALIDLIRPKLENYSLSATHFNAFISLFDLRDKKELSDLSRSSFILEKIIAVPQASSAAIEFGNILHAVLQYVFYHNNASGIQQSYDEAQQQISLMNYADSDKQKLWQRLDNFFDYSLPELCKGFSQTDKVEVSLQANLQGALLNGRIDYLHIDSEQSTMSIVDYKSGGDSAGNNKLDDGYQRQLIFYKILLQNHPDYKAYDLLSAADTYIEPLRDEYHTLPSPVLPLSLGDEEMIEHYSKLIVAAYNRIKRGQFDLRGFLETDVYIKKDKEPTIDLQRAFEDWIVATDVC